MVSVNVIGAEGLGQVPKVAYEVARVLVRSDLIEAFHRHVALVGDPRVAELPTGIGIACTCVSVSISPRSSTLRRRGAQSTSWMCTRCRWERRRNPRRGIASRCELEAQRCFATHWSTRGLVPRAIGPEWSALVGRAGVGSGGSVDSQPAWSVADVTRGGVDQHSIVTRRNSRSWRDSGKIPG